MRDKDPNPNHNHAAITQTIKVVIPPKEGDKSGVYDSLGKNIGLPNPCSSFYIVSISGASAVYIDMDLYSGQTVRANFPELASGDSFGTETLGSGDLSHFTRFVMYNKHAEAVTVEMMVMRSGTFRRPGSGGGGVAKRVTIDGTARVAGTVGLTGKPAISIPDPVTVTGKVSIDGDMPSKVKIDGAVALAPDTSVTIKSPVTVTGKVSIDGTLPSKVSIDGAVALAPNTAVTIPDTVNVKLASGAINVDPVPVATNLQPTTVVVGTTIIKLIGARPKRASMSIQSDHGNSGVVKILSTTDAKSICGALTPNSSASFDFTGELYTVADNDNQTVYVSETYNK